MKSSSNQQVQLNDNFYKICVVGGGLTGAIMMSLLEKSNMFHDDHIRQTLDCNARILQERSIRKPEI